MNEHPANSVFRAVMKISRSCCSNHRRDSEGWPLGNCVECQDYRMKMDAWHTAQVMGGNHDPDRSPRASDDTIDRNAAHADGWGWPEQPLQANSQRKTG